jgi:hypothetical protein
MHESWHSVMPVQPAALGSAHSSHWSLAWLHLKVLYGPHESEQSAKDGVPSPGMPDETHLRKAGGAESAPPSAKRVERGVAARGQGRARGSGAMRTCSRAGRRRRSP